MSQVATVLLGLPPWIAAADVLEQSALVATVPLGL